MNKGDRVVCVDDSPFKGMNGTTRPSYLKKDSDYIAHDFAECVCGAKWIDVGIPTNIIGANVCACCGGKVLFRNNINNYYKLARFRKVEERKEYRVVKSEVEIKEHVYN